MCVTCHCDVLCLDFPVDKRETGGESVKAVIKAVKDRSDQITSESVGLLICV